jgi:hypothetical protein
VYVGDNFIFKKKLTYYLKEGRPGLFVGTATGKSEVDPLTASMQQLWSNITEITP